MCVVPRFTISAICSNMLYCFEGIHLYQGQAEGKRLPFAVLYDYCI